MQTFNQRIQEGILNGTVKEVTKHGVRCYLVEPPRDGEEVVGYTPADCFAKATVTERARHEAESDSSG